MPIKTMAVIEMIDKDELDNQSGKD